MIILLSVTSNLVFQRTNPLLQPLLTPLARTRSLVLHHTAMAHVELMLFLFIDFLLVGLAQLVLVLYPCCTFGNLGLPLDPVVRFVAAKEMVSSSHEAWSCRCVLLLGLGELEVFVVGVQAGVENHCACKPADDLVFVGLQGLLVDYVGH